LFGCSHGLGPTRAGRPLEPGSRETDLESVFGEPSSRGALREPGYLLLRAQGEQETCNLSLSSTRTGWTETRTKQITPACKAAWLRDAIQATQRREPNRPLGQSQCLFHFTVSKTSRQQEMDETINETSLRNAAFHFTNSKTK
jgi:hypothetical protein